MRKEITSILFFTIPLASRVMPEDRRHSIFLEK